MSEEDGRCQGEAVTGVEVALEFVVEACERVADYVDCGADCASAAGGVAGGSGLVSGVLWFGGVGDEDGEVAAGFGGLVVDEEVDGAGGHCDEASLMDGE